MSKTPKLRFKEFSGDWESKKFGTIIDKITGGGTPSRDNPDFYNGSIPWLTVKDLKNLKYIDTSSEFITDLGLKNSSSKLAYKNDLIIPTRMAVGRILIAKNTMAINQDLKVVRLKENYNTEFMYYNYLNKSTFIERLGVGSTVSGISMDDLNSIRFFTTSHKEQEKIASFLSLIDERISLQGEKVDALKVYKKGMMQKIFSRELRFKDDDGNEFGDWEEKKFKEIIRKARLGGNYTNSETISNCPLIKMGNLGRGNINLTKIEYVSESEVLNDEDILKKGDVLFNTRNTLDLVGKVAIWRNELELAYYNSNLLRLDFKEEFVSSNYFMNYLFNSHNTLSKLKAIATGTTSVAAIYMRDLENIKFDLPTKKEQEKIGDLLLKLDIKIEREQDKLDYLNEYKKGLLQQMFV